jgi:hypothetical protein
MRPEWTARQVFVLRIVRALAFVGLVLVAALVLRKSAAQQSRPRVVDTVDRPVRTPDESAVFEPQRLIAQRQHLRLSARQVQELRKLDASYERVAEELTRKRDAMRTDVPRFLDEAQKHKGIASSQLQEKMAALAQVQQDIANAQGRFRKAARGLLTREQQMVAEGG